MITLEIPTISVDSGISRIEDLLKLLIPAYQEEQITLDFSHCGFVTAEATAILAGIKLVRDNKGRETQIDLDSILNKQVKLVLQKRKFLHLFDHNLPIWNPKNSFPIYQQEGKPEESEEKIINYITEQILRSEMPQMSKALSKEIKKAFFELFGNIYDHSQSPIGGIVCGQVYPKYKEIQIVFYDTGIGLARCVRDFNPLIDSDSAAIKWALRRGTSTLSNEDQSRGLGLYLLHQFIRANEGEFRIYANTGLVEEKNGKINEHQLNGMLNGTLIDMRINIRKNVIYTFSDEEI